MNSVANDIQVAGTHYRTSIQHWDFVANRGMGYFEGQVTKYVTRWRKKNGVQDLQKARHFLAKMIELDRAMALPVTIRRTVAAAPQIARALADVAKWAGLLDRPPEQATISVEHFAQANDLSPNETRVVALVTEWEGDMRLLQTALTVIDEMLEACERLKVTQVDSGEPGSGYVNQDR